MPGRKDRKVKSRRENILLQDKYEKLLKNIEIKDCPVLWPPSWLDDFDTTKHSRHIKSHIPWAQCTGCRCDHRDGSLVSWFHRCDTDPALANSFGFRNGKICFKKISFGSFSKWQTGWSSSGSSPSIKLNEIYLMINL